MRLLVCLLMVLAASSASAFSFATGGCTDGCADGEQWLHTNANEIDAALDALEAGTSIASALTRDTEWDTIAEIETAIGSLNVIISTEIDTLSELNTILGDGNFQTEDTDLTDLADGSLTGSKVGTGISATNVTTGTLPDAQLPTAAIVITEIDTIAELNAVVGDADLITESGTYSINTSGFGTFTSGLSGAVNVTTISATTASPAALTVLGGAFVCTNAAGCDVTLPAASAGLSACFYDANGGGTVILDAAAGDAIYLDGVSVGTADAIDSAGSIGDFVCLLAIDSNTWLTLGRSGTWVDGGAD